MRTIDKSRLRGMTLLELMISITILGIVSGVLFALAATLGQATRVQEAKVTTQDDARQAMMIIVRDLRQAATASIVAGTLPGASITYRVATDNDGNGSAVDVGGNLEVSGPRTIQRDVNDLNRDGLAATQLIMIDDRGNTRVLANGLLPNEDRNNNGLLDLGEDANANGALDRGLWFAPRGRGIAVLIQTQRASDARGTRRLNSSLTEVVIPRN